MISDLLSWLLLILIVIGWLAYKYQFEANNLVDFSLSQSSLLCEWFSEFGSKFKWFSVVKDERVGNYRFKELIIEVTGREMSAFEIKKTLEQVAWTLGFLIKFDVVIKDCSDHDLIRVIYVIPEWVSDYNKMMLAKNKIKREQELKRETLRKPISGLIKKSK